jgi:DNA-binding transcriptional LysR family regulator
MGVELFVRTKRSVVLTPAALSCANGVGRRIEESANSLQEHMTASRDRLTDTLFR